VEKTREIESTGDNVDQAIAAGLDELGVERDAVTVQVLDEGSKGLLGIGSRPARVRLVIQPLTVAEEEPPPPPAPELAPESSSTTELKAEDVGLTEPAPTTVEDELEDVIPAARQTLVELLEKMGIQAEVEAFVKPPEDEEDYEKLVLNIRGRDLGALIGRRGETLDALQFVTRLIVGREVERRVNLVVDVEGYRVRRERSLRQLARRMAERAVATGRRQVLEPMPAAERRIVHMELRNHAEVTTASVGQDENRKVTIFLRGSE
jgi:spoIIIJ-associated protein